MGTAVGRRRASLWASTAAILKGSSQECWIASDQDGAALAALTHSERTSSCAPVAPQAAQHTSTHLRPTRLRRRAMLPFGDTGVIALRLLDRMPGFVMAMDSQPPVKGSWRDSYDAAIALRVKRIDREWCCWRGLNSRPLPYQGSALPLSYNSDAAAYSPAPHHRASTRAAAIPRLLPMLAPAAARDVTSS